jgi:hypothetical protein
MTRQNTRIGTYVYITIRILKLTKEHITTNKGTHFKYNMHSIYKVLQKIKYTAQCYCILDILGR